MDKYLIAPWTGRNNPYTLIIFFRSLQLTSLFPEAELFSTFLLSIFLGRIRALEKLQFQSQNLF